MFDKVYLAIIAITVLIIISLTVYNRSIKSELEKSNLTIEKTKAELALAKQSSLACEEKIIEQNNSIEAYLKDMDRKKAELGGKYNALNKKYEALKNRPEPPPQTCEERLNQINVNQERFLE